MANSTIYPYGTGGQLPSNIGIIDDLVTGGSDKALSAQQGVVLKTLIDKKTEFANVDEDGIFFVDEFLNIGVVINTDGLIGINTVSIREL